MTTTPASAAGSTDLSITKMVRVVSDTVIAVPDDFDPRWGDTRAAGGYELVDSGLRVWTGPNNPGFTNKAAEYVATDTALHTIAAGDDPTLSYTPLPTDNANNQKPGFQLVTDLNGDGTVDGILVGEPSNLGKWWLGRYKGQGPLDAAIVAAAPHPPAGGGPSQGPWGLLDEWDTKFPNATVVAFGFSLGSNSGQNNGVISAINFNGKAYTFGTFSSSVQAPPGATVEYRLTVANGATGANATGVTVNDVLPADLTPDPSSLEFSGPDWCDFNGNTLSCTGGTLPAGSSAKIWFKATISDDVSSAGLGSTIGHHVDVQKQEVFADLTAGQTKSFTVMCPSGYVATDGGLLVDAVDQGGYYSDIVVAKSVPTSGGDGWLVKVSNLGDQRGQGKVKVTCLDGTIGSANGHTHDVVVTASNGADTIAASSADEDGEPVTVTCPTGYTPVAPQHTVTSGIAVIRSSYADGSSWKWTVDHEAGTAATFDVSCLAPETTPSGGHTATLPISTSSYTISADPESRTDEVVQCGPSKNGIVGGYDGEDAALLSLGKESRGNNYMFRFWNDDWDRTWDADLSVTCVGVRTADEPVYYHIRNTATISTSPAQPDLSTADNSSTADIAIVGDAVQPAGGVVVEPSGDRVRSGGYTRKVTLGVTCTSACAFTVKVLKGSTVVAKATKSLAASPDPRFVNVPTTSAGKNLAHNDVVTVKIKTSSGTTSTTVTLN